MTYASAEVEVLVLRAQIAAALVALAEISAHLSAPAEPVPDEDLPANVRRLVASGRRGPGFAQPIEQYVLGPKGLRAEKPSHTGPCVVECGNKNAIEGEGSHVE